MAAAGLSFTACNSTFDDLAINPNQQDVNSFYTTPANVDNGIKGIYSYITTPRAMGISASRILVNRSDEESDRTDYGVPGQYCASLTPSWYTLVQPFQLFYTAAAQACQMIESIPSAEFTDQTKKNAYLGEAYFLRAYCHWFLFINWRNIPLMDRFPQNSMDYKAQAAPADTWEFIIADLKTLDVGRVEVKMAADETADAVAISGLGTVESIAKAIHETQKQGIYSILDMMNVAEFEKKLAKLPEDLKPDIVLLHRNVDMETYRAEHGEDTSDMTEWGNIKDIKAILGDKGLIAVAGGIKPNNVEEAISKGANIIIAGRYIIGSRDVRRAAQDFLEHFDPDPDNMRLAMDEDENIEVKDD